jgi:S1-C subfamily serine protease
MTKCERERVVVGRRQQLSPDSPEDEWVLRDFSAGDSALRPSPRGGAADKAGITAAAVVTKRGDRVIPDGDSPVAAIRSHVPGDTVTLTIKDRSGASRTVQVTLKGTTANAGN